MKINFMLIDDNEVDIFLNSTYIKKEVGNCHIISHLSAIQALSDLKSKLNTADLAESTDFPDVILVDINMPEMSGFSFLEKLAQLENYAGIKNSQIFLISSSISQSDINKAEEQPICKGFISKPLTPQKIKSILDDITIDKVL